MNIILSSYYFPKLSYGSITSYIKRVLQVAKSLESLTIFINCVYAVNKNTHAEFELLSLFQS